MSINDSDQPLGQDFLQNPYEYFQSFVRNMNNQVFLSEYQLNHLYALLLLRKESPWDQLKPNSPNFKAEVQTMVNSKVADVKKILESLSQMYEDKLKKNTFTQLERLMNILKARNKSIFIEKEFQNNPYGIHNLTGTEGQLLKHLIHQKLDAKDQKSHLKDQFPSQQWDNLIQQGQKFKSNDQSDKITEQKQVFEQKERQEKQNGLNFQKEKQKQSLNEEEVLMKINNNHQEIESQEAKMRQIQKQRDQENGDQREVLSLFYGIANIPNLSSLALGNCLQYNAAERYIKFKMSKRYIMTIKNEDQLSFDRSSMMKNISGDLFVHGMFPYLTAVELFKARGVCKQWMENVKQAWHSTFKREMFVQLMACEFCKQIEFYYKLIQLRNPFFQKISLLMHALIEIIQWDKLNESISNNTIIPQLKKVLIILLKLLGEDIVAPNLNAITEEMWLQHKDKILTLKQRIAHFLNNIESSGLSILDLIKIKIQLLDDPFMRVEELNSEDKTPLLLVIFIKQLTLQQILKNHIYFSQEYLMKTKNRLDNISSKMPQQKGFLEGVYKIILLRNFGGNKHEKKDQQQEERTEMPNFSSILTSIFQNTESNKPDFVLKSKSTTTNIYMDKATKFDIIFSTVKKMNAFQPTVHPNGQNEAEAQSQIQRESEKNSQNFSQTMVNESRQQWPQQSTTKKPLQKVNTLNIMVRPEDKIVSEQQKNNKIEGQFNQQKLNERQGNVKPEN